MPLNERASRHRRRLLAACGLALAAFCGPAVAQIPALPQAQIPGLPDVGAAARGAIPAIGQAIPLADLRKLRLRDLVRANPRVLELERGEVIVRHEVVAVAPSAAALARARAAGFGVTSTERLEGLDTAIVTLTAPDGVSTRRALARLRALDPQGVYDFNHVYADAGGTPGAPKQGAGGGDGGARVGLIDGGVDARQPMLAGMHIAQRSFAGATSVVSPHGTAVASLLTGCGRLYAADVYGGAATGGSTTALARALAWMAAERVAVVNVSLVGPPNRALQAIIAQMVARGFLIVAAVGNDGPAAPPLYPASYPGVIGVTGVNARGRVLVEAARGPQVDFAAPGADVNAAGLDGKTAAVRGTSFAAPVVAGLLAQRLSTPGPDAAARAVRDVSASAQDLGAPGRDDIYGAGLVGRAALAER